MQSRSLLLDTGTWDILLDDTGNLAITDNPHAVAQDVACACSTFLGECWYDSRPAYLTGHASSDTGPARNW